MDLMQRRRELMHQQGKSYVKNGLIYHWVSSDSDGNTWTDRVSGLTFNLNNVSVQTDGGLYFNGSAFGTIVGQLELPKTAEFVFLQENKEFVALHSNCTNNTVVTIANNQGLMRFDYIVQKGWYYTDAVSSKYTIAGIYDAEYCNMVKLTTGVNTGRFSKLFDGVELGARLNANGTIRDRAMKGTIYQIRFYSRALSESEILNNQSIDTEQYGIV